MKIIEAMKKIKELLIKADDLKKKVAQYHADLSFETAVYGDKQREKIREWTQACHDVLGEVLKLRVAIQRTNLVTMADVELGGKIVRKSIAEWIHRRRDLAGLDLKVWDALNDKGLKEGQMKNSAGEVIDVKIRRYYDPEERDRMRDLYSSEPGVIDRTLEVVNAVTDLIEA